jgi:hypothetical protein
MGLLAEGRGRVVVATSADIQAHWEPLIGEVDMGSQDIGLAQGFFDPSTDTVFLIADHIEAGQEMAVAAHELAHKHGKAVLGEAGWRHLHEVIGSWANRPEGSLERRVYDEAMARVQASRPDSAAPDTYSSEELFPYAVQVAMELGVQPTALMPANSVQGWLARVRAAMHGAWDRLTNKPELFDSKDLVDLAFAVAQRENPAYASEFSEASAPVAPTPGITAQQLQRIVDKVLKGLGMRGTVTPTIMKNPTAAGLVAPESMPSGGVSDGRLYLFLEGIRDEVEGFRVVFHELFHLGLSQSVTLQEYRQTMLHLLADPLVRKYAARWKNSEDGHSRRSSMPINNWHALAVEEALADMAEEIHHERGGVGTREMADWVRRTIAWMADLAHHWGMPGVARRLRGMTLTQAEAYVVDTVLKARTGGPVLLPDARWATSRQEGKNPNLTKQLDEASQEPPTPRLDVSDKFNIKRYDGMTDIDYLDAENGTHGLNAYINRDGILSLEIRAQGDASILGSGTDMFSSLMKRINNNNISINGINGVWELGTDSVNAAEFVQNINTGMTREQAAMNTWTGRIASRYGYTVVLVPDQLGGVQFAYFRRPN